MDKRAAQHLANAMAHLERMTFHLGVAIQIEKLAQSGQRPTTGKTPFPAAPHTEAGFVRANRCDEVFENHERGSPFPLKLVKNEPT